MRKIRTILAVICILASTIFSPIVFAAENPSVSIGSATAEEGDTVSVSITLNDLPDISYIQMSVTYDEDKIKLISVSDTGFLEDGDHQDDYSSPYTLQWGSYYGFSQCNTGTTGSVAVLEFQLLSGFTSGNADVTVSVEEARGTSWNSSVSFSASSASGQISVKEHEHSFGSWTQTKEPTCMQEGEQTRSCTSCGYEEIEVIEKTDHVKGEWEITKEATCAEEGRETQTCSVCGEAVGVKTIEKKEHTFGSWTVVKEATIRETGLKERECEECGYVEEKTIAKLAHEESDHEFDGKEIVEKEATCTEAGSKKVYCSVELCEEYTTVTIPKTGHTQGKATVEKEATCAEAGKKVIKCTVCNVVLSTQAIEAIGHDYGKAVVEKEAMCMEDGVSYKSCKRCNEKQKIKIPAYGEHQYGDIVVEKIPSCMEAGSCYEKCERCGDTKYKEIPAYGEHKYGAVVVEKEATCMNAGSSYERCERCGDTKYKEISALGGHRYGELIIVKEATQEEDGECQRICEVCQDVITEIIPMLSETHEHDFSGNEELVREATCAEKGQTRIYCAVEECDSFKTIETPETGHSFGEWAILKEATQEKEGTKERTCSLCQATEQIRIDKIVIVNDDWKEQLDLSEEKEPQDVNDNEMNSVIFWGVLMILGLAVGVFVLFRLIRK